MPIDNTPQAPPWYESNLLWGPMALGGGILLTVVAAMKADLRWLLWLALPFFGFACWIVIKQIRGPKLKGIMATICFLVISGGLYWMNAWLRPTNPPSASNANTPTDSKPTEQQPLPNTAAAPSITKKTKKPASIKTPEQAQPAPQSPQNEHVSVKIAPGAKWYSTNDTINAPNGTAIENKGEITSKGLRVNPPPSIQNCPNGICAGGDINGNPTVINNAPEPKISYVLDNEASIPVASTNPRQCAKISVDRLADSPQFAVICDRECKAVWGTAIIADGGVSGGDRWGTPPGHPTVAAFLVGQPNPLPSNVKYRACVESLDAQPIHILSVVKIIITDN